MSPLTRALRAVTALVTVWCLACASFEPLLAGLLGTAAAEQMACGSGSAPWSSVLSSGGIAGGPAASAVPTDRASSTASCGCEWQGCLVPSLAGSGAAVDWLAVARVSGPTAATLISIVREPLVPPPQRAL